MRLYSLKNNMLLNKQNNFTIIVKFKTLDTCIFNKPENKFHSFAETFEAGSSGEIFLFIKDLFFGCFLCPYFLSVEL